MTPIICLYLSFINPYFASYSPVVCKNIFRVSFLIELANMFCILLFSILTSIGLIFFLRQNLAVLVSKQSLKQTVVFSFFFLFAIRKTRGFFYLWFLPFPQIILLSVDRSFLFCCHLEKKVLRIFWRYQPQPVRFF